jgi:hypothetical protein
LPAIDDQADPERAQRRLHARRIVRKRVAARTRLASSARSTYRLGPSMNEHSR